MRPVDVFDTAVDAYATRLAVVDGDVTLDYAQMALLSRRIAALVATITDDEPLPIAICSPNDYRAVACTLGIMRAGGVVVPLHTRNSSDQLGAYLAQLKPRAVFYHSSVAPLIRRARACVEPCRWICLDGAVDGDLSLEAALERVDEYVDRWGDPFANSRRPVFARQTSGTTGTPKVVIGDVASFAISHLALQHRLAASLAPGGGAPVCLVAAPFSHAAGLHAFGMFALGATLVLRHDFDTLDVLASIARYRVTHMWLPASALNLLLAHPDLSAVDCSSLRQVLIGASAPSPAKLKEAVAALGPCIAVHYGQIEGGFLTWLDERTLARAAAGDRPERLASSGTTMHVGRVSILHDDGRELPRGEVGEIVARSLSVKPYMTSLEAVDADEMATSKAYGWHHTGDLGYIDAEGYLYVVGRKKDMVITGGFKVAAAEVERVIMELPEVAECAVIAVPDVLRGEAPKAIITVRRGAAVTEAAVLTHCRAKLGRLNAPVTIEQWPELPRTSVGKIDKHRIRERFWANADRDVN